MKKIFLGLLIAVLTSCTCCKNENQTQCMKYHDDGRAKPEVAILPMIDSTSYELPWSLSDEFTDRIINNIVAQGKMYIPSNEKLSLSSEINPFGKDLAWINNIDTSSEFLVILELIEHENESILNTVKNPDKIPEYRKAATNLHTSVRLRIIDIRKKTPKVVLQEVLKDSFYLPNTIDNPDYNIVSWGHDDYPSTPLHKCHSEIIDNITTRINDYIILSKSR